VTVNIYIVYLQKQTLDRKVRKPTWRSAVV